MADVVAGLRAENFRLVAADIALMAENAELRALIGGLNSRVA